MSLASMTGFARHSGEADWGSWYWEGKSVNGRGLEIRTHLPYGWESLEKPLKSAASGLLARGNVTLSLKLNWSGAAERFEVNERVLGQLIAIYERLEGGPPTGEALAMLMGVRGVVESQQGAEMPEALRRAAEKDLLRSAEDMLAALKMDREQEGRALAEILRGQLSEMKGLASSAANHAGEQVSLIQQRYRNRLLELDSEGAVSEDRIATEVAALAAKADVTEELDRLSAHIRAAHELLESADSVGRKLGFLSQELNREANTLCSKSVSLPLTDAGLALKGVIDQFREQAANVE